LSISLSSPYCDQDIIPPLLPFGFWSLYVPVPHLIDIFFSVALRVPTPL
jgi:hypothetical protein